MQSYRRKGLFFSIFGMLFWIGTACSLARVIGSKADLTSSIVNLPFNSWFSVWNCRNINLSSSASGGMFTFAAASNESGCGIAVVALPLRHSIVHDRLTTRLLQAFWMVFVAKLFAKLILLSWNTIVKKVCIRVWNGFFPESFYFAKICFAPALVVRKVLMMSSIGNSYQSKLRSD